MAPLIQFFLAVNALASLAASQTTTAQIMADLEALDTSVNTLTSGINAYNGGLLGAFTAQGDILGVMIANRKTYFDGLLLPNQTSADSAQIIDYVGNVIAVDIPQSVNATEAKKAQFVAAGLESLVKDNLVVLKYDHDSLSQVLLERVSEDQYAKGAAAVKVIDDAIQAGIDDFSS